MTESASCRSQREALAVEALHSSGHLCLQVRGESMLPTLWPDDIAEIAACSLQEVGRGEIVLAFHEGRFFLHRFLASGERANFITRGDSMPAPDPAFPAGALLGRLVSVHRDGRRVNLPPRSLSLSRLLGLLFGHSNTARRAALMIRSGKTPRLPATDLETA